MLSVTSWFLDDGWRVVLIGLSGVCAVIGMCVLATYDLDRRVKQDEARRAAVRARAFARRDAETPRVASPSEETTRSMPKPPPVIVWP